MVDPATSIDLALVLAVDVSASVDFDEFGLMIGGYAEAFRTTEVQEALLGGTFGTVAIAMLFWSGAGAVEVAVPWTRIASAEAAADLAAAIEAAPRQPLPGGTALGDGLAASLRLLAACPWQPQRSVIDVSGDGRANQGIDVAAPRLAAELAGIGINGLVVLNEEPDLASWYAAHVIAGPGAFVIEAADYRAFAEAIRRKLAREADTRPLLA